MFIVISYNSKSVYLFRDKHGLKRGQQVRKAEGVNFEYSKYMIVYCNFKLQNTSPSP